MKKFRRFLGHVCFILAVLLLGLLVFTTAGGKTPSIFGYRILRVVSSSMEPVIPEGTCILVKETKPDTLKTGDVITFVSSDPAIYGFYNTHRIFDIYETAQGETRYITKGDSNEYPDDYDVAPEQIVGKLVKEIPGGRWFGRLVGRLHERNIYFLVVILPLLLCLISYIWQLAEAIRDKGEEKEE